MRETVYKDSSCFYVTGQQQQQLSVMFFFKKKFHSNTKYSVYLFHFNTKYYYLFSLYYCEIIKT